MENEIWRDVVGYEGLYQVSNTGNIKSLPNKNGKTMKESKILKARLHSNGYLRVALYKDKIKKDKYIHRLVAEAFLHNPNELEQVNHINGDKKNNYVNNLEWMDRFGNMRHAHETGLMKDSVSKRIEKCGKKTILTDIKTNEKYYFKTHIEVSLFLGYEKSWLAGALRKGNYYKKIILDKGYYIELGKV